MSIFDVSLKRKDGTAQSMADYKGKVLLIVNTATGCGFTPQYEGLEKLYKKYKDKGLEILDFPCNQFANQTPENDAEIYTFCTGRFGITFPQFAKIDVNGENEAPIFSYLKNTGKNMFGKAIKWNFTKFLIDRDGTIVGRFAPIITPEKLDKKIEKLL